MTKLIDLSREINNDMPVHPYDESVKLEQDKFSPPLLSVNNFEIMAFPLKIKAEASLTRVVAKANK